MFSARFGSKVIQQNEILSFNSAQEKLSVNWEANPHDFYTLIMYDISTKQPYIHLLIVNIPGDHLDNGDIIIPYHPPSPPSGTHDYYIVLYKQFSPIGSNISADRHFDVPTFIKNYRLQLVNEVNFKVSSQDPSKFCDCVLEVKSKDNTYNPYAVCAKNLGTSYRDCSKDVYNFETMSLEKLRAYAALHNLPTGGTREELLSRINRFNDGKLNFKDQVEKVGVELNKHGKEIFQQLSKQLVSLPNDINNLFKP